MLAACPLNAEVVTARESEVGGRLDHADTRKVSAHVPCRPISRRIVDEQHFEPSIQLLGQQGFQARVQVSAAVVVEEDHRSRWLPWGLVSRRGAPPPA